MGRLALLTPPCGGQCADREEKRVAHGNEINRQQGKTQEQLDLRDPNQRGFSKKVENHAHSVAIHTIHYNFVRIHQTLHCTPAVAAGVTTTFWELADMVKVLEVQARLIRMTAYIRGMST